MNLKISSDDEFTDLGIQMIVAMDFIKSEFGQLTIEEIKEAFKMYVARKFQDIKVFRILDAVSIGEVLNAYIEFRNRALIPYERKKEQLLLAAKQQISDSEIQEIRNEYLKSIYDDLSNGKHSDGTWQEFKRLEASGVIKITEERKREIYAEEKNKYASEQRVLSQIKGFHEGMQISKDLIAQINSGKVIEVVRNRCWTRCVNEYLQNYLTDFETFKKAIE